MDSHQIFNLMSNAQLDWMSDVFIGLALDLGMTGFAQQVLDTWALS